MVRTAPSQADRTLIETLAAEDIRISHAQLERWRARGLLPRPHIRRETFGGSRVEEHTEDVADTCRVLGAVSRRGTSWQYAAYVLFEEGGTLSKEAVRGAALWEHTRQLQPWRRAWEEAVIGADVAGPDPQSWVEPIASRAAQRLDRETRRLIREEVELAHPNERRSVLREYIETATIWRIADICAPGQLSDQQRQWARHGTDGPVDHLAGPTIPLPSERRVCINTLTWGEMRVARWSQRLQNVPLLQWMSALSAATWWVTASRLHHDFARPDRPIPDELIADEVRYLEDLSAEIEEREAREARQYEGQEPFPELADI